MIAIVYIFIVLLDLEVLLVTGSKYVVDCKWDSTSSHEFMKLLAACLF